MGARQSKRPSRPRRPRAYVRFDDFEILRAIGRGAFGKVCLVERKESKKVYAMKYVNKEACLKQRAVDNVAAEVELLRSVDHPFVVSLWFTFQDIEDLFIVLEPLMGGDLRYHLNAGSGSKGQKGFSEEVIRFIIAEVAMALDFLRTKAIVHRDVKPDNILLDDLGHAHLTDFNVATYLNQGTTLNNMAGTKPYMAPEVFETVASPGSASGYGHPADWWSLGVTAYEMKTGGRRPFDIQARTTSIQALRLFENGLDFPGRWSPEFTKFVTALLTVKTEKRVSTLSAFKKTKLMGNINFNSLEKKKIAPPFVPDNEGLNCDPTYELEEMIVEAKPLHKKKKRLLRQQSLLSNSASSSHSLNGSEANNDSKFSVFPTYSREWERYQESLREKERAWELELMKLMEASALTAAAITTSNTVAMANGGTTAASGCDNGANGNLAKTSTSTTSSQDHQDGVGGYKSPEDTASTEVVMMSNNCTKDNVVLNNYANHHKKFDMPRITVQEITNV